ncbi:hypothetical protein SCHPADRAFT_103051 [Schizopora paradoxa]|uniref:Uncharacterized protein n=1 Tax=Schizopora paradoxa TaxID=27342 RepID=A0A0H2SAT7_9AGAM|nr:hypothetical protein SCHPADRAFT_103051 [Schizopora paradoxa]
MSAQVYCDVASNESSASLCRQNSDAFEAGPSRSSGFQLLSSGSQSMSLTTDDQLFTRPGPEDEESSKVPASGDFVVESERKGESSKSDIPRRPTIRETPSVTCDSKLYMDKIYAVSSRYANWEPARRIEETMGNFRKGVANFKSSGIFSKML